MASTAQDWSSLIRYVHNKRYTAESSVGNLQVVRNADLKITITQHSEANFWAYVDSGVCSDPSEERKAFPFGEILIVEGQSEARLVKTAAQRSFFMEELRTALSQFGVRARWTSRMASIQLPCTKYQEMEWSPAGMWVKKIQGAVFYGNFTVHSAYLS